MLRRPSRKLFLADLVLASLLSGLFIALFTPARAPIDATIVFFLIVVVIATWSLFHQRRQAPTCEECGRRFIQPKRLNLPAACPRCGREQPRRARRIRRTKAVFWGLLGLLVLLGITTLTTTAWLFRDPTGATAVDGLIMIGLGGVSQLTLLAAFVVGIYYSALARPKDRPCEACRSTIPVEVVSGPKICPRCRLRHLRPVEARKEHARGLGLLVILLLILSIPIALSLWDPTGSKVAGHPFLGPARLILNLAAMMIAAGVMWIALSFLLRMFRLRSERGAIAMARRYAGQGGEVIKDGPSTIWFSGPDDPEPMLREQMEAACRRFGELAGNAVPEPALRFLVFHDRAAFLRFHSRIAPGIDLTSFDGLYLGQVRRLSTLCTAPAACRITDLERTIRSLGAYALLESLWGPRPPAWLQSGLVRTVAVVDRDALARLNRKMIASLSLGTTLSAEMFGMTLNGLTRLLRGSKDPRKHQRFQQFHHQSWSVLEYLREASSSGAPPADIGGFLVDQRSRTDQEGSFRDHFGRGFAPFLEEWRRWVMNQGIGRYEPPPPGIGDALLDRVLPVIRDPRSRLGNRILAIREWAHAGYVLGADALIDLLREPGDVPKEEIVWALCMVSGMAWGDEPERWQAWWDELPLAWDGPREPGEIPSIPLAVEPSAMAPDGSSEVNPGDRSALS